MNDKTVWKYPFDTEHDVRIAMPKYAEILTIQVQDGVPCIWARVDPTNELEERSFKIYGTGHVMSQPEKEIYVGTYQERNGSLVWHVFDATIWNTQAA